jgi:pyrroline-5-carboxylate reductase
VKHTFIVGAGAMGGAIAEAFDFYGYHLAHFNTDHKDMEEGGCVILTVKPEDFPTLAEELKPKLHDGHYILSMMAGVSIADIKQHLGPYVLVARAMPSIACVTNRGLIPYCTDNRMSRHEVEKILQMLGGHIYADEKYFPALTALVGGGPAYVASFFKAMVDGGVALGLEKDLAAHFVHNMLSSSTELLKTDTPDEIVRKVCSPGGSTERAVSHMNKNGFGQELSRALLLAASRFEK